MEVGNYLSFFSTDYPASFGGNMLFYGIATFGQLTTSVLAMMWFWDSFRRLREDPHPKQDPVTVHRLIMCFLMAGTFMRIFPMAAQNLIRPEISELWRMRWALATNMMSGLSVVPFTIAIILFVSSRYIMEEQLKKQPFAIDITPRWSRVKRPVWIIAICAFLSVLAVVR